MADDASTRRFKRICGRVGAACWVLILPAKLARHLDPRLPAVVVDAAPSLLGPAGLLLVLLSDEGRLPPLTVPRAMLLTAAIALSVEFSQLLPIVRPLYRFDWLDVGATLVGAGAAASFAAVLRRTVRSGAT